MPSLQLEAELPLGGFRESFDETELAEVADIAIVSLAIPLQGEAAFEAALLDAYGVERPAAGQSVISKDGRTRFLWTAQDQLFALIDSASPTTASDVAAKLDGKAYVTLQSDNWVALRLAGSLARTALERICPIDLDASAFPKDRVARTAMEHMGAFICRDGENSFLLLSASSSANSYLHAVRTSLQNVA
ncbi:MAG: sarcosine oxidase subunit gamma [Pseudomonadota bacterium]